MTLPNFLVVGAGRSGTTSLHHYLGRHPDVFMAPDKSPNFFVAGEDQPPWEGPELRRMARQWITDRGEYEALFDGVRDESAIGEASPVYLQALSAPRAIHELCPDARIVAILRDPAERAYAHYLGRLRDGLETRRDFAAIVDEELTRPLPEDVAFGSYLGCGRYHHFLRGYYECFPTERIRVYLFDDLVADSRALLTDLFAFLGVDATLEPDTRERYGRTGQIRNRALRFVWTRSVPVRTALRPYLPARVRDLARPIVSDLERPSLDARVRARIVDALRPDVETLQHVIGRDLAHWLR